MESAFRAVDRGRYVAAPYKAEAYVDSPLPIGFGQTISAPHMHAACCEQLIVRAHATEIATYWLLLTCVRYPFCICRASCAPAPACWT